MSGVTVITIPLLHSKVSGRYINSDEQDMKLNLNFQLVAANKLLEDLIGDQCIAELRDTNVAHDFETTLQHVGLYLSLTDPQLDQTLEETQRSAPDRGNLEKALRKVRNFAERQGLAGITPVINKLGIIKEVPADGVDSGRDAHVQ